MQTPNLKVPDDLSAHNPREIVQKEAAHGQVRLQIYAAAKEEV